MSIQTNAGATISADKSTTPQLSAAELEGLRHILRFLEGNLLNLFEAGPPATPWEHPAVEWADEEHLYVNLRLLGRRGPDVDISFHGDACCIRVQA